MFRTEKVRIQDAVEKAIAKERAECVKVAESYVPLASFRRPARTIAKEIRNRGSRVAHRLTDALN